MPKNSADPCFTRLCADKRKQWQIWYYCFEKGFTPKAVAQRVKMTPKAVKDYLRDYVYPHKDKGFDYVCELVKKQRQETRQKKSLKIGFKRSKIYWPVIAMVLWGRSPSKIGQKCGLDTRTVKNFLHDRRRTWPGFVLAGLFLSILCAGFFSIFGFEWLQLLIIGSMSLYFGTSGIFAVAARVKNLKGASLQSPLSVCLDLGIEYFTLLATCLIFVVTSSFILLPLVLLERAYFYSPSPFVLFLYLTLTGLSLIAGWFLWSGFLQRLSTKWGFPKKWRVLSFYCFFERPRQAFVFWLDRTLLFFQVIGFLIFWFWTAGFLLFLPESTFPFLSASAEVNLFLGAAFAVVVCFLLRKFLLPFLDDIQSDKPDRRQAAHWLEPPELTRHDIRRFRRMWFSLTVVFLTIGLITSIDLFYWLFLGSLIALLLPFKRYRFYDFIKEHDFLGSVSLAVMFFLGSTFCVFVLPLPAKIIYEAKITTLLLWLLALGVFTMIAFVMTFFLKGRQKEFETARQFYVTITISSFLLTCIVIFSLWWSYAFTKDSTASELWLGVLGCTVIVFLIIFLTSAKSSKSIDTESNYRSGYQVG